jgi:hypothetical protein
MRRETRPEDARAERVEEARPVRGADEPPSSPAPAARDGDAPIATSVAMAVVADDRQAMVTASDIATVILQSVPEGSGEATARAAEPAGEPRANAIAETTIARHAADAPAVAPVRDDAAAEAGALEVAAVEANPVLVDPGESTGRPHRTMDQQAAIELIIQGALLPPAPNKPFP